MIASGSKGHIFYTCIKKYDFGTHKHMRKEPVRADFEWICFYILRSRLPSMIHRWARSRYVIRVAVHKAPKYVA